MKRMLFLAILSLLSPLFASAQSSMPGPDARELWQYIAVHSSYTSWAFWQDHKGLQKGAAPHTPQHRVFVNDTGLSSEKQPLNFGTIMVKENLDNDSRLKSLSVMYKIKGYNPVAGDWFWVRYSPEGKVERSGKMQGCIGCHSTVKDNDYLFSHTFKKKSIGD